LPAAKRYHFADGSKEHLLRLPQALLSMKTRNGDAVLSAGRPHHSFA